MFATRFWTPGYREGLGTLFAKLDQGVEENAELLALARARADAEAAHGAKLVGAATAHAPRAGGFGRDDGASMRLAYDGMLQQLSDEGTQHTHIAESIRNMVIDPFSVWSAQHNTRVIAAQADLNRHVRTYERELAAMQRAQHRYFNRCRLEEDSPSVVGNSTNGETSASADGDTSSIRDNSSRSSSQVLSRTVSSASENTKRNVSAASMTSASAAIVGSATSEELELGGKLHSADESQQIMKRMLEEIPQKSSRVRVLGTYEHTVTGAAVVAWLTANSATSTLEQAEQAGQMLVSRGFLRLIGQVGSRFVNSSVFVYQWRPLAWEFAGLHAAAGSAPSALLGDMLLGDMKQYTGSSLRELDQKYRKSVMAVEHARLELELKIVEHAGYLERCERERLTAFKAVLLDLAAAISNVVPALSAGVDQLLLFHETAQVDRDLRFFIENYQTGRYTPRVFVYDNYYSSTDGAAVFGLDLELRARADKRRVPRLVGLALGALDKKYPKMENDEERLALWQRPLYQDMRLAQAARQQLNRAELTPPELSATFDELEPLAIVQALKLFFLELPHSVAGGPLYDILRGIYARYGDAEQTEARVQALQNTLAQLTLTHIATLDALTSHLKRLITIADSSESDLELIAAEWGPALCRPKQPSALYIDDVFPAQLLRDLLSDRERLFGELKRQQSDRAN